MLVNRNNKVVVGLNEYELFEFYRKFIGKFIWNGNKGLAVKRFDEILLLLKNEAKKSPFDSLSMAADNVLPLFTHIIKKMGKKSYYVPTFCYSNKRYVLIFNWFLKTIKNRTNVRGVKIEHLVSYLIQAKDGRGLFIKTKINYYKQIFKGRHLMSKKIKKKIVDVSTIYD